MKTIAKRPARTANTSSRLVLGLLLGASGWAFSAPAMAQPALAANTSDVRVHYDIPAQPLADALVAYARQSDLRVLSPAERLSGLNANALQGAYTREQALALLLARSGVSAAIVGDTIQIDARTLPQRQSASSADAPLRANEDDAQAALTNAEDLVVTGTRIRGAAPAGANLIVLDRDAIDATGRATLQDVIQTLPQNFAGSQNEFTQEGTFNARSNFTWASTVDLRGLGADATLTLVNGRRLAPAGVGNFVDISVIPLSAIERIEILGDGASASYGADAVAGVVNVILDRQFEGGETQMRVGGTTQGGGEDFGFSQAFGRFWTSGHVSAAYEYRRRGDVDILDRQSTRTADFRDRGGSNFNRTFSNPGNITRIGATSVNLAIPTGQDGTDLSESDLIAGAPNYTEIDQDAWLLPQQEGHSAFLSFEQALTSEIEFFVDVLAGVRDAYSERANLPANLIVPESNYYRQLNDLFLGEGALTIAYHFGDDLGAIETSTETRALAALAGFNIDLPARWRAEAAFALARSGEDIAIDNFYDSSAIAPALASSNAATAFNPFADGSNTPASVLAGLTFAQYTQSEGESRAFTLKFDGPLWRVWGGDMRAAIGGEMRRESFEIERFEIHAGVRSDQNMPDPGARDVSALFGEVYLPLVGETNAAPFIRALTLSLSARWEDASDYGDEITPKVGIDWALNEDLHVRASWGRAFKGPQFQQMLGEAGASYINATPTQDPLADNGSTGVLAVAGPNPNLEPERAQTWTLGLAYAPQWAPRLRLSATYFDIDFADRITAPGAPLTILRNPLGYESIIYRDPSPELVAYYLSLDPTPSGALPVDGVEVIIDRRNVNLSSQRVRGGDIDARYRLDTAWGEVDLFTQASLLFEHSFTLTPAATPVSQLDTLNNPVNWRMRSGFNWRNGALSGGLAINYVDNYTDNVSLPARTIEAWRTADFRFAYDWRAEQSGAGGQIALSIQNLTDAEPPFVNNSTGSAFDASNASPLGRIVSLSLRRRW